MLRGPKTIELSLTEKQREILNQLVRRPASEHFTVPG